MSRTQRPEDRRELALTLNTFWEGDRVARFFLVQDTKTGKTCQTIIKYTKLQQNIPNGNKIYQMATNYTKWQQNIPNGHKIDPVTIV
jgi:hypothetical protein